MYSSQAKLPGEVVLETANAKLSLYKMEKEQNGWQLCQRLLNESEGVSYKSLMVTVYCEVIQVGESRKEEPYRNKFMILEEGDCGFDCSPKLEEVFRISKDKKLYTMVGMPRNRTYGIPMCTNNAKFVASRSSYLVKN